MTKLAVLISGRGSNMATILEACAAGTVAAQPVLVASNRPDAVGLATAAAHGVAAEAIDHRAFSDRATFEAALDDALQAAGADLVACAGFMRVLTPWFVSRWEGRLINIHPALLPSFKGLDTHARARAAGVRIHGCTVHFVSAGVDEGAIIGQAALAVRPDETEAALSARVLALEHLLYPRCIDAVARGLVFYENGRAQVDAAVADKLSILAN